MAGHSYTLQVQDPAAQKALLDLQGQVKALTQRVVTLEGTALVASAAIDAQGQRITNVALAPEADSDVVTLAYLRAFVAAQGAF